MRKGGAFLVEETPAQEVFTPEDFREEHKMLIKTTEDFVKNDVVPHIEELENKNFDVTRRLVRQAGALGLLGADVPEEYGGGGPGVTASLLVGEHFVGGGSLSVVVNCHTGIGSMPLVFFGNKAQKAKYLPGLASGEKIGAYVLTEPGAGTDALSMQATAVLTPDGKYYKLNGTKQFITNGRPQRHHRAGPGGPPRAAPAPRGDLWRRSCRAAADPLRRQPQAVQLRRAARTAGRGRRSGRRRKS